eukprot:scaffold183173_cov38-Prasinocladus_malaysianus.AAC.1
MALPVRKAEHITTTVATIALELLEDATMHNMECPKLCNIENTALTHNNTDKHVPSGRIPGYTRYHTSIYFNQNDVLMSIKGHNSHSTELDSTHLLSQSPTADTHL